MTHSTHTNSAPAGRGSRFLRESRGASAVAFTLAAPVALLGIAGVISYLSALEYQQQVQLAADAAALAAAQALTNNAGVNVPQIAQNYFNANAPAGAANNPPLKVVSGTATSGRATVEVDYSGSAAGLFSLWGGATAIPVTTHSTAYAGAGTNSSGNTSNGGNGGTNTTPGPCVGSGCYMIDVSFSGATTNPFGSFLQNFQNSAAYNSALQTNCNPGAWYNMLSDAGIQINITCAPSTYFGGNQISAINIMLNIQGTTHVIGLSQPQPQPPANGAAWAVYPAPANYTVPTPNWQGEYTLDGVLQTPPSSCINFWSQHSSVSVGQTPPCSPSLLNGTVEPIFAPNAATNETELTWRGNLYYTGSSIYISYPGYTISIDPNGYGSWDVFIQTGSLPSNGNNGMQYLENGIWNYVSAVGAEGAPGGWAGQTAAGVFDQNMQDFQMSGPTAVSYQYNWSWPGGGYEKALPLGNLWWLTNPKSPIEQQNAAENACIVKGESYSFTSSTSGWSVTCVASN